jgi:hypothetical protein
LSFLFGFPMVSHNHLERDRSVFFLFVSQTFFRFLGDEWCQHRLAVGEDNRVTSYHIQNWGDAKARRLTVKNYRRLFCKTGTILHVRKCEERPSANYSECLREEVHFRQGYSPEIERPSWNVKSNSENELRAGFCGRVSCSIYCCR